MIENHMVITTGADIAREQFESRWESEMDQRTKEWAEEIESCFADVTPSNFHRKTFPKASYKTGEVLQVSLAEVISYEMSTDLENLLAEVIAKSQCQHVRAFRDALCKEYVDSQADSLAEVGEV